MLNMLKIKVSKSFILDRNEKVKYYIKMKDLLIYYLEILYRDGCQSFLWLDSNLINICVFLFFDKSIDNK